MTDGSRANPATGEAVRVDNPHVVDLRGQRPYNSNMTNLALDHATVAGMSPMATLTHEGWALHVEDWRTGAGLVAICAPGGRNVLLLVEGGGYGHWTSALTFLPLWLHRDGLVSDGEDLARAWTVVSRVHEIALSKPTWGVATNKAVAEALVEDIWWALLPPAQVQPWRAVVGEAERAETYWRAGLTPQDVAGDWGMAERDKALAAMHVASLFGAGVDPATAAAWLKSLSWPDEWPGLIKAGYSTAEADALFRASWVRVGGMAGHAALAPAQGDLRRSWVAAGLPASVAVPAMAAGLSLDEALAPDPDLDVLAAMAALRS